MLKRNLWKLLLSIAIMGWAVSSLLPLKDQDFPDYAKSAATAKPAEFASLVDEAMALYAAGEVAFTGLHGANRMASNSLLECLVIAASAADDIRARLAKDEATIPTLPIWDESQVSSPDERIVVSHNWDELRRFMWDYVGIVRTNKRLERAHHRVKLLQEEIIEYYGNFRVSNDLIELRNLVTIADLTIECALNRKESRGLHYTLDYPDMREYAEDTILTPNNFVSHAPIREWGSS
jgi:L-aspartate oxidase